MRWQELALRLALIVSPFGAVASGLPAWFTAPLSFLSIAVTAELAVRPYAASAVDKVLLGCGAVVTTLILVGIILNLTPWGLTQVTWNLAWLILSTGILVWHRRLGTHISLPVSGLGTLAVWVVAGVLIIAAAGMLALAGVRHVARQPVLAFALVSKGRNSFVVEVEATSMTGRYHILATSNAVGAHRYISPVFAVEAGANGARFRQQVPINTAGIWTIDLQSADSGSVVRWLRVDAG
jgi:hypothetical protein